MNYAVIDLGSNTIRLSVYSFEDNTVTVVFSEKAMAGLAGYVENERLTPEGVSTACETLENYLAVLTHLSSLERLAVFATASLRNVENTQEVICEIKRRTGICVEVISGEEEARLDFVGATYSLALDSGLLVDIGGGSTELVTYENTEILDAQSVPMGSLNLSTRYVDGLFPTEKEQKRIRETVLKELENLKGSKARSISILCGVGGSIRATLKLYNRIYKLDKDNQRMDVTAVEKLFDDLCKRSEKEKIKAITKSAPDRLHTLMPGMLILLCTASRFGCEEIWVSSFGVREGYLYEKLLGKGVRRV